MTLRGRARFFCAAAVFLSGALLASAGFAADRGESASAEAPPVKRAWFSSENASREARRIADWVVDSKDARGMPFIIVDKPHAQVFVFDAYGHLLGAAPALLGLNVGDRMVPPITGDRETSEVPPRDKITPAGRFWAQLGRSVREEVLWVDYDTGLSLHPVLTTKPEERRLQRLKSKTIADNRISAGCINVPKEFYEKVVSPAFQGLVGAVYILPDSGSAREIFNAYDVDHPPALRKTSAAAGSAAEEKQ
jgi:hypothetical protein